MNNFQNANSNVIEMENKQMQCSHDHAEKCKVYDCLIGHQSNLNTNELIWLNIVGHQF